MLDAARTHRSTHRYALKPDTLYCLIGLLAVTGMRAGEALSLKPEEIDWVRGVIMIGRAKYQKTRLIPLHASTLRQLRSYTGLRQRFFAERPRRIGMRDSDACGGPRIHDLRHRFAVATLLRWYRSGRRIDPLLPVLSTYMGHVSITGTYWYLTCTPELMAAAGARLEKRWEGGHHAQR